ncbi:MAG: hypothetical protein RKU31_03065 [Deltaproteobacteria bacterium]
MSVPATRTRALVYAGVAVVLFSVTLLVSRLADFGVVPAEEFGAGDWKRGDVKLQIDVVSADGIRHPLPSTPELRPGDRLHLAYGKTRYTSLWVVRIGADRKVRPLVPAPGTPEALGKYGRRTENAGEALDLTIEVPDEEGPLVLLGMFSAVPRRLDEIQAAADAVASDDPETIARTLYIPSRRFVHVIEIRRP